MIKMNSTASSINGVLNTLQIQLSLIDNQIKSDINNISSCDRQLKQLYDHKQDLLTKINHKKEWIQTYEKGPLNSQYIEITNEIEKIYNNAKKGHSKGIKLLEEEFNYHPAFKRPGDTFTATAFRPK